MSEPRERGANPWAGGLAAAGLLLCADAAATNGYFSHGYSVAQRALGGAGTAFASDALVVSVNPANLVWVPERFDLNLGLFSPRRWYSASERGPGAGPGIFTVEPGTVRSERERFGIPALAYSRPLGPDSAWGIALYGNGGMNTDYRGNSGRFAQGLTGFETHCGGSFGGGAPVGGAADNAGFCGNGSSRASVDLIQVFLVPSYARRFGDRVAVGIAPVLAVQRFQAVGLEAFARFSNQPDKVTGNYYDYGYGAGARAGVTVELLPFLRVGASWQSRIRMSEFEDYAGLFADEGDFDIPSNWNAGLAYSLTRRQRVLIDYQHVNFNEVRAVGNPLDPNRFVNECAFPRLRGDTAESPACLGAATGPGFGWRDVRTLKLGYELRDGPRRFRLGYSRNGQPIPAGEVLFNLLAPAVPQEHYTAGLSWQLDRSWFLDVSVTYANNHPVTGKNPLSNAEATEAELVSELLNPGSGNTEQAFGSDAQDQDITLRMMQFETIFGLSYHFGGS